jgi:hypothetical protein
VKLLRLNKVYYSRANNGTTPLHIAVKVNFEPLVRFYVEEMGVDPNEPKDQDRGKITPMALAISRGFFEIAQFLYEKGATITPETFY